MTIIAVDIGNTTISLALMSGRSIKEKFTVLTSLPKKELKAEVEHLFRKIHKKVRKPACVIICSVVPSATQAINECTRNVFSTKPLLIGKDIIVSIKNNYHHPAQVGQDRLVCAFAAKTLYGTPAIVIDLGTAITLDVVSEKGSYEGGLIVPGIRLSAESLFRKTALLPRVDKIKAPKHLVGKNTKESMLSGLFYGYGAMCSGLVDMISRKIQGKPKVVMTGGYADVMKKFMIEKIDALDKDLVFKGMALLIKEHS